MKHLSLLYAATGNVLRHKLRSVVVLLCLLAILFPFLAAVAILDGVRSQSCVSVEEGADIYVTMDMYGRNGVIPMSMSEEIERIDGVVKAVPRVISRIYIGGRLAVLLGITRDEIPLRPFLRGKLPGIGEIALGKGMAEDLKIDIGGRLEIGARIITVANHIPLMIKKEFRVAGVFHPDAGIWTTDLVLMDIDDANEVFEMEGFASDVAVYVKPGSEAVVSEELQKMNKYFRIQTKELVKTYVERGFSVKGGIFVALYTVAFALAIPAILVSSGLGLSERRKEIGILKATGWKTHEVLEMVVYENIIFALTAALLSFLLAFIWVKFFNGFIIAQLFIGGIGNAPAFPVPSRFMPMPFLLSLFFSLVLTMVGSIYASWKAATVAPVEAIRQQ